MSKPGIEELTKKIKTVKIKLQTLVKMHTDYCPARFVNRRSHCLCGARENNKKIIEILSELD